MLSTGLWRWYINITITILDIIHRPVFYLKLNVSETGICLRLQVESTQFSPIDRASLCLWTPAITPICWILYLSSGGTYKVLLSRYSYYLPFTSNTRNNTNIIYKANTAQTNKLELIFSRPETPRMRELTSVFSYMHWKFEAWRILTLVFGLCRVSFVNHIGFVAGVRTQKLALSIGVTWVVSLEDR
jgi:hypothetical protein